MRTLDSCHEPDSDFPVQLYPSLNIDGDIPAPTSWILLMLMWISSSISSHHKAYPPSLTTQDSSNFCHTTTCSSTFSHQSRLFHLLWPLKFCPTPVTTQGSSTTTQGSSTSFHHSRLVHLLSPTQNYQLDSPRWRKQRWNTDGRIVMAKSCNV